MDDRYQVTVRLNPSHQFYHSTKVLSGLCALHRRGRAQVSFLARRHHSGTDVLVDTEVKWRGMARRLIWDLRDRSDVFAGEFLSDCDTYLKRSYFAPDLAPLTVAERSRVCPFGLNYACTGGLLAGRLALCVGRTKTVGLISAGLRMGNELAARWNELKNFLSLPTASRYEAGPEEPAEGAVLFQTRVSEPEDVLPDNADEVNESRVALVRALKRAFGDRLWGGVIPTSYAIRHYPDVITNLPCFRRRYVARSRRALIAVYTRGLHHSIAFKLPEYLASSKAIVADGFRNELPYTLAEGSNYLRFSEPAECVEQCSRLLGDTNLVTRMRQSNRRYYLEEVEPSIHVLKCLNRGFNQEPA
jgi:hypothetical protein